MRRGWLDSVLFHFLSMGAGRKRMNGQTKISFPVSVSFEYFLADFSPSSMVGKAFGVHGNA